MSSLEVTFPDEWATIPVRDGSRKRERDAVTAMPAAGNFFDALLPSLDRWGIAGLASLALADEEINGLVQAYCAIAVVPRGPGDVAAHVRDVAEGGPHPGLERDSTTVELPLGPAVRSSAFRFVEELLDDESVAPYTAEVRFAFPLAGDRVGVLHFETLSLACYEELAVLFDAIAQTARIA
jgi:hypothetical protein